MYGGILMDEILDLLRQNARLSVEDIAAMTKKTPEEVQAIIKSFEDEGIILKYAAIVNPEKIKETKEKVLKIVKKHKKIKSKLFQNANMVLMLLLIEYIVFHKCVHCI